ncbi:MAG: hypothetical protein JNL49_05055 [Bacteroidia bacterium]|nr:hypothetical protein [Bacteroidia bacterium]
MPTIEIVSYDSTGLELSQADFDIAIIEENKLESHRGLFYDLLKQENGVIVHIGNPDLKDNKNAGFYAGKIIDWEFEPNEIFHTGHETSRADDHGSNQQSKFKFLNQYKIDIDNLLKIAIDNSPIKKICFLTDYQFGPKKGKKEILNTITDFWRQHDSGGLGLNTMYEMYGK